MSSNSSIATLLHLVEHLGERGLQFKRLLDLVGAHERIFTVFEETRALMLAQKLDERWRIGLPVFREAFEILENRAQTSAGKDRHGILSVFVEVGVEDALIHEVGFALD